MQYKTLHYTTLHYITLHYNAMQLPGRWRGGRARVAAPREGSACGEVEVQDTTDQTSSAL